MTAANFRGMVNQTAQLGTPTGTQIRQYSGTAHTPHGVSRFSEWELCLVIERNGHTEMHGMFSGKKEKIEELDRKVKNLLNL